MSSTRVAAVCIALLWLGGYPRQSPLEAQVLAMPPSMAVEPLPGQDAGSLLVGPSDLGLEPEAPFPSTPAPGPATGIPAAFAYGGRADAWDLAGDRWDWQSLPSGLVYRSYLAGGRESRLAAQVVHERDAGWLFDATLGGRAGLLRYGSRDTLQPEGWQLDVEGAAFPRVTLWDERFLVSSDFRGGFPLTFRRGPLEAKFAFYHLSSHLGDQFMLVSGLPAISYSRDALVLGLGLRPAECLRLYAEADWAFHTTGFSDPWQFQFGAELSAPLPTACGGGPFVAVNGVIRQDVDYGGNLTVQAGWQWRGTAGQLLRAGFHYFNGKSDQGQFFDRHEELIGMGLWYDF